MERPQISYALKFDRSKRIVVRHAAPRGQWNQIWGPGLADLRFESTRLGSVENVVLDPANFGTPMTSSRLC
eukprot:scaffold7033_cov257-Pinguiococcus_pyrenoidosus.AAC.37